MRLPLHTRMDAAEGLCVFLRLAARLKGKHVSQSRSMVIEDKKSHRASQQSSDLSKGTAQENTSQRCLLKQAGQDGNLCTY